MWATPQTIGISEPAPDGGSSSATAPASGAARASIFDSIVLDQTVVRVRAHDASAFDGTTLTADEVEIEAADAAE